MNVLTTRLKIWNLKQSVNSLLKKNKVLHDKIKKEILCSPIMIEDVKDCLTLLRLEITSNNVVINQYLHQLKLSGIVEQEYDLLRNYNNSLLFLNPYKHITLNAIFKPFIDETIIKCCNIHFVTIGVYPSILYCKGLIGDILTIKGYNDSKLSSLFKRDLIKRIKSLWFMNVTIWTLVEFNDACLFLEDMSISSLLFLVWCFEDIINYPCLYYTHDDKHFEWKELIPYANEINDTLMVPFSGFHIHNNPHKSHLRTQGGDQIIYFNELE